MIFAAAPRRRYEPGAINLDVPGLCTISDNAPRLAQFRDKGAGQQRGLPIPVARDTKCFMVNPSARRA